MSALIKLLVLPVCAADVDEKQCCDALLFVDATKAFKTGSLSEIFEVPSLTPAVNPESSLNAPRRVDAAPSMALSVSSVWLFFDFLLYMFFTDIFYLRKESSLSAWLFNLYSSANRTDC